jgi:DNA modification methylase
VRPYYDDGTCVIYHADCRDVLPELTGIGLVLTSPPYNLREGGRKPSGSAWAYLHDGYASYSDDMPRPEYLLWQRAVLLACWDALADDGAIYYNHKQLARGNQITNPLECIPEDLPIRQILTWDRGDHGVQRSFWHYCPADEWIVILAREAFRLTTMAVSSIWRIRPSHDEHPASFPLELAHRAIGSTSAAIVLDPFMGGGTTLRAAKVLGRRAIGIEIEERYCEIAAKRLAQEVLDFGGAA